MTDILARMHTGEHILFRAMQSLKPDIKLEKIDLKEDESSFFVFAKELTWDDIIKAEEIARKIIDEDKKVTISHLTKEKAAEKKELRIRLDRIKDEKVRVVEIEGHDLSACKGNHCESAGQVGDILVTKFNAVKGGRYEIRFTVDPAKALYEYANSIRKSASFLNTEINQLHDTLKQLKENAEALKERTRELSKESATNYKTEKISSVDFHYGTFDNIEKKQLIQQSGELEGFVCFPNKTEKGVQIILHSSTEMKCIEVLKPILEKFDGKGGGKDDFAMGAADAKPEEILAEVKNLLK